MKKLAYQKQSEIFEKLVRDRSGRVFRVCFAVVERNGVLRGKVISVTPITVLQKRFKIQDSRFRKESFYLPGQCLFRGVKDKGLGIKDLYFSPYFNKFAFLTTIKIRAPSSCAL